MPRGVYQRLNELANLARAERRERYEVSGEQDGPGRPFKYTSEDQGHQASLERFEKAWAGSLTDAQGHSLARFERSWGLPEIHAGFHARVSAEARAYSQRINAGLTPDFVGPLPNFVRSSEGLSMASIQGTSQMASPSQVGNVSAAPVQAAVQSITQAMLTPSQKAVDAITKAEARLKGSEATLKTAEAAILRVEAAERRRELGRNTNRYASTTPSSLTPGTIWSGLYGGAAHPIVENHASANAQAMMGAFMSAPASQFGQARAEAQQAYAQQQLGNLGDDRGEGRGNGLMALLSAGGRHFGALGIMAAAGSAISSVAKMSNTGNLARLTSGQQSFQQFGAIPGIGHAAMAAREVARNLHGTNALLENRSFIAEETAARMSTEHSGERRIFEINTNAEVARLRAQAVRNNPIAPNPNLDRMTTEGMLAYQQFQRTRPVLDNLTQAQRERETAQGTASIWQTRAETAKRDFTYSQQRHQTAVNEEASVRARGEKNPIILQALATRVRDLGRRMEQDRSNLQYYDPHARESQTALIEAESRVRHGLVGLLEDEVSRLKDRAQLTRDAAGRFGSMNPADRAKYASAAYLVHTQDWGSLPYQTQRNYAAGSPEEAARRAQEFGITTPEYQAARARGDLPGTDADFSTNLARQTMLETNINVVTQLDPEQLGNAIANALSSDLRPLLMSIKTESDAAVQRLRTDLHMQNASQ